ncbi:hypothetical protein [Shewanella salipaludis]|uniref:DUF1302 family protein n=1 Tax=Shewanella salipaludis TaxID=2723052 RepID=A0A972JHZ3_9GAMM|nr:hypothetical protein [Shewanella salipaludis]NMH64493.1 hypothetical protein [Shewanella salipaludis]
MALWLKIISLAALLAHGSAVAVDLAQEAKLQYLYADSSAAGGPGMSTDMNTDVSTDMSTADYSLLQGNYRFKLTQDVGAWSLDLHYVLGATASDASAGLESDAGAPSWFDWRADIRRSDTQAVTHFIDRASLEYSGARWVAKLGRQAITWGNGNVFQVLDLFNPFAPAAMDTSYKPGVDLLYLQRLFDSGAELQGLWVPHKCGAEAEATGCRDSLALKYLGYWQSLQFELMLAQDYGDKQLGLGLVLPLGTALAKLDLLASELVLPPTAARQTVYSAVLNLQHSWQWWERPLNGFVEYYLNGFADDVRSLDELAPGVRARLQRGQLFSLGRDQFAIGLQLQYSPLLTLAPTWIYQANDGSSLSLLTVNYNSSQSSNLVFGAQFARGEPGSQYGGLFVDASRRQRLASGDRFFLRYEYYF